MKISVIVPVYNKIKYLSCILHDLKNQSFKDFECILIDDGSRDGSETLCDRIAEEDSRFIVKHIPNGGVSHARNFALDIAQGEYITFVDSDDRIALSYLQNLYDCIENTQVDIVISNLMRCWDDGRKEPMQEYPYFGRVQLENLLPSFVRNQKEHGFYGFCVAKIFKRSFIQDIRFDENIRLAEDFDFYLRLYAKIKTVYFDNHYEYYYLQATENSSMSVSDYKIDYMTQLKINLRFKDFLCTKNAYSGENKYILNQILENYIFCSMFYAKMTRFNDIFSELRKLADENEIMQDTQNSICKKILMKCFWNNRPLCIKLYLYCYRGIRKVLGRN